MPRGGGGGSSAGGGGGRGHKTGHKGQRRHFTNPDDLVAEQEKQAREKQWRQKRGQDSDDDDESGEGSKGSGSDSSSSDDDEATGKNKGVEGLIEVENPNRVVTKTKKVSQLETVDDSKPELSRREREEIEKQRAKDHYQKLHAAGKTDDARADLARLAIIKQQREIAAKKREEEIKAREAAAKSKTDSLNKALGKNKKT